MILGFAHADGAPCPTVVVNLDVVPAEPQELLAAMVRLRRRLTGAGLGCVLKYALIAPSHTGGPFDIDYRFVQALPGGVDRFDVRGSCGHSILSALVVAAQSGMVPPLVTGARARVSVLNNGDQVSCTVVAEDTDTTRFDVQFVLDQSRRLPAMMINDSAVDTIRAGGRDHQVSLVSVGNPYVFLAADTIGAPGPDALFTAGNDMRDTMVMIRRAAAVSLGWCPDGAFPKVAALGARADGAVFARAMSVTDWHPTLALTGVCALAAATALPGTIPYAVTEGVADRSSLRVATPAGETRVSTEVTDHCGERRLHSVKIHDKTVRLLSQPISQH